MLVHAKLNTYLDQFLKLKVELLVDTFIIIGIFSRLFFSRLEILIFKSYLYPISKA